MRFIISCIYFPTVLLLLVFLILNQSWVAIQTGHTSHYLGLLGFNSDHMILNLHHYEPLTKSTEFCQSKCATVMKSNRLVFVFLVISMAFAVAHFTFFLVCKLILRHFPKILIILNNIATAFCMVSVLVYSLSVYNKIDSFSNVDMSLNFFLCIGCSILMGLANIVLK